jgi:hypothetical protein
MSQSGYLVTDEKKEATEGKRRQIEVKKIEVMNSQYLENLELSKELGKVSRFGSERKRERE